LEKFLNLPVEKQNNIINAALKAFGTNGYKKTSTSDIAATAGISKAMVFHYFRTKKSLYFYLMDLCGNIVMKEVSEKFDYTITDFFERIRLSSYIEISLLKKYPAILTFLTSVYFEEDEEVKEEIKTALEKGEGFRNKIAFDGMDFTKFKDNIDLKVFMKMLSLIGDGYAKQLSNQKDIDYDVMFKEFDDCLEMLKNNLYKEEYL
jgi:TetR/AcrR family transcriptional regulator